MLTTQTVFDQLTGEGIVQALTEVIAQNFEDFAREQKQYEQAMTVLQKELGETNHLVKDEMDAIVRQTASDLLFSGVLGIKANLDHFIDPMSRSFMDVSFETYLREITAHKLPDYVKAQKVRDRFYALLTPNQRTVYEAVMSYVAYLETVGPKLAHYYGYLLGNKLLYRIVPGYHADMALTMNYCMMLEDYFGKCFLPTTL